MTYSGSNIGHEAKKKITVRSAKKLWLYLYCTFFSLNTLFVIYFYTTIGHRATSPRFRKTSESYTQAVEYLVYSNSCRIAAMDPYSPTVKNLIHVRKEYLCPQWNFITYQNDMEIIVNNTVVGLFYPSFSFCSYQPYIKMPQNGSEKPFFLKHLFKNFKQYTVIKNEFVQILCFNTTGEILTTQHYGNVIRNETLTKYLSSDMKSNGVVKRPMNVVMLVLESTSRLNFIRHMNSTRDYIISHLGAVEFLGYNKMGLNTFPNMVSLLLGIAAGEIGDIQHYFDQYPFIWKEFRKLGYATLFGQDHWEYALFHYNCLGFKDKPVDYYMRPYVSSLEKTNRQGLCSGNTPVYQSILNRVKEFITNYNDIPHFTFTIISRPTHDDHNALGILDLPILKFLTDLHTVGHLDNTVVMLVGDHGTRFGPLRNTFQGRLEENLPALYIAPPKWFKRKHSDLYNNLRSNTRKLTSNFDIYSTLCDIMDLSRGERTPRMSGKSGTSLFRNIATNRRCHDLKIPPEYCSCLNFVETTEDDSVILELMSDWIVKEMNHILAEVFHLCAKLSFDKLLYSWKSDKYGNSSSDTVIHYVVFFRVLPSKGLFEGNVLYKKEKHKFVLLGSLLRMDKYNGQSKCVSRLHPEDRFMIERYCHCRSLLKKRRKVRWRGLLRRGRKGKWRH